MHTDIHALCGIRAHDPSVRASEDSSCLRPRGHCDRPSVWIYMGQLLFAQVTCIQIQKGVSGSEKLWNSPVQNWNLCVVELATLIWSACIFALFCGTLYSHCSECLRTVRFRPWVQSEFVHNKSLYIKILMMPCDVTSQSEPVERCTPW
jgi:hypothetical protein